MANQVKSVRIAVEEENCCGCMQCMMMCAATWSVEQTLSSSHIEVSRNGEDLYRFNISFDGNCRAGCQLCARWCAYGALTRVGEVS
ncbi:hypothetical protein MFMK1_001698 [Metallumcola ferriviriculae]|uniref:4Fe-4S ferredoxin-type domain-containing protein n=1 Tax=Metallumcola ferriviriculae TaxID=3039180 RepID=A0AAU0UNW4_9FIRM|nr:hypothetical protein MFMK1_001698 [Desulfitibacteraceae bacterium MK1]